MKLKIQVFLAFLCLLLFLCTFSLMADERTRAFESKVLDNFDDDTVNTSWVVRGSKFITEGYPKKAKVNAWPDALHGKRVEDPAAYNCLGITAQFDRQGYNYLEVIPSAKGTAETTDAEAIFIDEDGTKWVSSPINLYGRVDSIDLWVWGSNYNYYLEVHVEDYLGTVHVLPLGDLLYAGWKNLYTSIPMSIPQAESYIPSLKTLKIVKFMVWTRPNERVTQFYIYFDYLKILADMFESSFDGDDLEDPKKLEEVWGTE